MWSTADILGLFGLQIAKYLVAHGFTVLVWSRNFERGEFAAKAIDGDARALQLDVTDQGDRFVMNTFSFF